MLRSLMNDAALHQHHQTACHAGTLQPRLQLHRVASASYRLSSSSRRQRQQPHTLCRAAAEAGVGLREGSTVSSVCKQLDAILVGASDGSSSEQQAVQLANAAVKQGVFKAFGRGRQVPKRIYTIEELRLNKLEPEKLLSPTDVSLNTVRNIAQGAAAAGLVALAYFAGFSKVFTALFAATFLLTADQVANMGGGEALVVDTLGRFIYPSYRDRVTLHEAGHFLVAYLVGLLPRAYTLSAWDAFSQYRALNVQAGTQFCDGGFEGEVAAGRISSSSLDKYSCVALAGVMTEYLRFGQAEGGVGDLAQLDRLMRALQFSQKKADGQVRWSVLNVAALLRRHEGLHDRLATAMAAGASVGACIQLIEDTLGRPEEDDALLPADSAGSNGNGSSSSNSSSSI